METGARVIKGRLTLLMTSAATLLAVAAACRNNVPNDQETEWLSASNVRCQKTVMSLDNLPVIADKTTSCLVQTSTGFLHMRTVIRTNQGEIPIVLGIDPSNRKGIERVFLNILGGPGTKISDNISPQVIYDRLKHCEAAIVSPIYMGSYERSLYPKPSHAKAEAEVGAVIETLSALKIRPHILAQSLAGNIISSKSIPIPAGDHLLFSPVLESPNELIRYIKEESNMKGVYQIKNIESGGIFVGKRVSSDDFNISYFGNDRDYLNSDFHSRWDRKLFVSPKANVVAVIAREEERAGGLEHSDRLSARGIAVKQVPGDHAGSSDLERTERVAAIREFADKACNLSKRKQD